MTRAVALFRSAAANAPCGERCADFARGRRVTTVKKLAEGTCACAFTPPDCLGGDPCAEDESLVLYEVRE